MGNICYSLKGASNSFCHFMVMTRSAAVEIRLDDCMLDEEQLKDLFSTKRPSLLIATYRTESNDQTGDAVEKLTTAILSGADYVDIQLDWPESTRRWLESLALNKGCQTILSYHDFKQTSTAEELAQIARSAFFEGADIVKIVTTALEEKDCETILSLYDLFPHDRLIAFAMGEEGYNSRLASFSKGAPLFYMAPAREKTTAPGQPVYFDFVEKKQIKLCGNAKLPASKSFVQRAILLAALTEGTTKLYGVTLCDDTRAAMGVAESLGAELLLEDGTLSISGHQDILRNGLEVRDNRLFVGESALLARLCIPLAGLADEDITITGEKSLLGRRVDEHKTALRKLGLTVSYTDKSYLPATVHGHLKGGSISISGNKGSQMISGMLLALSQCRQYSTVKVSHVTSAPYLNLTTYLASFFGLEEYEEITSEEDDQVIYCVQPQQQVRPVKGLQAEKDWSAAAMLMAAGAIMGDITLEGLNTMSLQADSMALLLMDECHIDIVEENGTVNVRKSILSPFYFDITDSPDLFAPLFLLASQAEGESVIAGINRLKNKESNRAVTFSREFARLGVESRICGDEISIYGHENFTYRKARCSAHGDHRLAMALYIASLAAKGKIEIEDMESVDKSFPNFVETIEKLKTK